MPLKHGTTSTSTHVKALSDLFERLAENSKPTNQFHSKRSTDTNKSNENGTAPTGDTRIEVGRTENETETVKCSKNYSCDFIAHEHGECDTEEIDTNSGLAPRLYPTANGQICNDNSALQNEIPVYDDYEDGQFTTNGQTIEDSVDNFLTDSTANIYESWFPLASVENVTEDDIFETTSFENDEFSIEVINCIGYIIINKININIIETPLNDKSEKNVNPSHLSHHNQLLEWCNQKQISNRYRDGSFECNHAIVNLVDELISTERTYIVDLSYIIKEYLNHFRQHPIRAIFGNIEALFEHSQNFYTDLCSCKYYLQKVASTFLTYDVLFEIYVQYIRNHPRYVSYLSGTYQKTIQDRTKALNDPFSLESHLLKPYQRLTRHRLLLQNIQKATETLGKTSETIGQAVHYLDCKLNRANSLVAVDTIKNCPFDLTNKGTLLLQNAFTTKGRIKTQEVFLFKEVIVFTEAHEEQKNSFCYTDFIPMNCVYPIPTRNYDAIVLTCKSLNGKKVESVEIETPNVAIRKKWITVINQLLFTQLKQAKVDRQKSLEVL